MRLALAGTVLWLAQAAWAGLPQPLCIYYGQAVDGFGWPYTTNAQVVLRRGSEEIASHTIRGSLSPGVNFALNVHLDDGRGSQPYSRRALRSGDVVSIVVRDAEGEKTIMESKSVPEVGAPGELILVNVTAATDADGDGLPDAWEQFLVDWSEGLLKGIEDVHPEDDFDGDGQSNADEYKAGTFAFLEYDLFFGEEVERMASGRFRIAFLSVPGKLYGARSTADLGLGRWTPSPLAASDTADFQMTSIEGTGGWLSLYLPGDVAHRFFRPTVETATSYHEPTDGSGLASLAGAAGEGSPTSGAGPLEVVPVATRPVLNLRRVGEVLELSWGAGWEAYGLEHCTDLGRPDGWSPVAAPVESRAGMNLVTLRLPAGPVFFRLSR